MIGVIDILRNDATTIALTTATRIYPSQRSQQSGLPAITVKVINNDPSDTKSGVSGLDQVEVEVISYGETYSSALAVSKAVRTALDRTSGTYNGEVIQSIRFLDQFTDYEEINNKPIHYIEQNFKVRVKL
jgi:hypothetical protein